MFEATPLNERNRRRQKLLRILFFLMTALLVAPVLIILGTLVYKGAPAISFDFLFTGPVDGMRGATARMVNQCEVYIVLRPSPNKQKVEAGNGKITPEQRQLTCRLRDAGT